MKEGGFFLPSNLIFFLTLMGILFTKKEKKSK
ncbi:hypothetical protein OIU76_001222 [Salix suchowensis]|nr:hypothetical protein OIU76_001222 [Salix suchowensis]